MMQITHLQYYLTTGLWFGIPDILVTDNGNEYINGEFAHFCRTYNVQFKPRTPYAPWSNGLVENSNRQLNTFFCTVLD